MSSQKLRIHKTQVDNLISNLRGEVGEVITTWTIWRRLQDQIIRQRTGSLGKDIRDPELALLRALSGKLYDELVARLSELGERKIGRLTFYFAAVKLSILERETKVYSSFIESKRFREKRNYDISHKELPEDWSGHKTIFISYPDLLRALAMALRLMKKLDRKALGPASPCLWREMRKKRYELSIPARSLYMMLPHFSLSGEDRRRIVEEEEREGKEVWSEMETLVDQRPATIRVARDWGIVDISNLSLNEPTDGHDGGDVELGIKNHSGLERERNYEE